MYTITLADGTKLENLTLNGNTFESDTDYTEDTFNGKLSEVHFECDANDAEHGEAYPAVGKNMTLNTLWAKDTTPSGKCWFGFRELSPWELAQQQAKQTQLDTDEMIASQEERIIMLELGLTEEV